MAEDSSTCGLYARIAGAMVASIVFVACSTTRPAPPSSPLPPAKAQYGVASWYGPGFDGHPTSSGEIYNQDDMTAACTLYPLGSHVMVTNLENGRSVEVRINDHGPYVKGRKIDLSRKCATVLGVMNPGTARVRLDLISTPAGTIPGAPPRYFVQVGSFANSSNADHLRSQLASSYPDVRVDEVAAGDHRYYRVRMGGFATRADAEARASHTAGLGLPMIIVSE